MPAPSHSALPTAALLDALRGGRAVHLHGLSGAAAELAVAALLPGLDGPLLWVCADEKSARQVGARLRTFVAERDVLHYPSWDVLPYKGYSPSAEVVRARLATLHRLLERGETGVVVVAAVDSLLKRVLPPAVLRDATETLRVGEELDREALLARLVERGYFSTDQCSEPGCFSVRGGILDLHGPGLPNPVRVEFWGDEIDSIRAFDPFTQRSLGDLDSVAVLPVREELLTTAALDRLPGRLKALADERGLPPRQRIQIQEQLSEQRVLQELELYLPVLQGDLATVFDYLGEGGAAVWQAPAAISSVLFGDAARLHKRWRSEGCHDRLVPAPSALFLDEDGLQEALRGRSRIVLPELQELGGDPEGDASPPQFRIESSDHAELRPSILAGRSDGRGMVEALVTRIQRWQGLGRKVVLLCRSQRRVKELRGLLADHPVPVRFADERPSAAALLDRASALRADDEVLSVARGEVDRGFSLPGEGLVLLSEADIFGPRRSGPGSGSVPRRRKHAISSFGQLSRGEIVVHALHGIGRFHGLKKLQLDATSLAVKAAQRERALDPRYRPGSGGKAGTGRGTNNDYLLIRYRGGDRLWVPVHKLGLLSRYVGGGAAEPKLDKLGGSTWKKRTRKASEDVQKVAKELLDLYAARQLARTRPYGPLDEMYRDFERSFPFETTPDQQAAIDAVISDMAEPQPMDRLICGDVGFGKTEVALRAAFRAVVEGRQVAVLVPTTILALQHFETFRQRMQPFPVLVEMLSRFRSAKDQKQTLQRLKEGRCDVVIGTHRLLGKDVRFKDLGLLVVDEEHRFGVKHKEKTKRLRAEVDVLTMTATPIPRTLNMALSGIRDLSIIETPPEGRRAVRTSVARFSPRRIQDAVRFELQRGGQLFFLHNRVKSIYRVADFLQKLVPEARLRVAHGQMNESELEDIMVDFFQRRFDVLLSTTIIESGIDVPTANTMIINRADGLGLAQLHQLRGRVGRSTEQGHCLLLVPPGRALRAGALARLKAIQDYSDLGAGTKLAQRDLEIRGAGSLLGSKQSGQIAAVGLNTYMELLEAAVRKLRGQRVDTGPEPDIELRADAYIPGTYISDERDRLLEYKRLCDAREVEEVQELLEELGDRYGQPPVEVLQFERLIETKVLARQLRILVVKMVRGGRLQLEFDPATPLDPAALMARVAAESLRYTFKPEGILLISLDEGEREQLLGSVLGVLRSLLTLSLRAKASAPAPRPRA